MTNVLPALQIRRDAVLDALAAVGGDETFNLRTMDVGGMPSFGVLLDTPGELLTFTAALAQETRNVGWIGHLRQTRVGLGTLTYWPGVALGR